MGRLKEETDELHRKAEQMPFNKRMMRNELTDNEYGQYLRVMKGIYGTIESQSEPLHPNLPRFERIQQDLDELDVDFSSDIGDYAQSYIRYLTLLDETQLQAHMYLHYLAIVYGGQMIKSNVPGTGNLYDFEDVSAITRKIRAVQGENEESWIPEVKIGFRYMIEIFDELDDNES